MKILATNSSPAEWSAAAATLLGAIGAFITAIYSLRIGKNNKGKIENVHEIVNGKTKSQEERNSELLQLLQAHNIEIPPKKIS